MLLMFIAVEERNHGAWKRYPEDVFVKSMLVFTRSVEFAKEALGKETYVKGPWPLLHASAKWFRLGELEFELNNENDTPEVHIHIPAGAKLTPEALRDTFTKEQAFMKEYLPEWSGLPHTCESWMMSPKLEEILERRAPFLSGTYNFDKVQLGEVRKWALYCLP